MSRDQALAKIWRHFLCNSVYLRTGESMNQDDVNLILIRAVHQILHRLRSNVGGSDKETAENVLANLETTDPDFNRFG